MNKFSFMVLLAVIKQLIVLFKTKGLTDQQIRTKANSIAAAILLHIADFPSVLPLPAAMQAKVTAGNALDLQIDNARIALKNLEDQKAANLKDIVDTMNIQWTKQVQTDAAGDLVKITESGMDVKGMGPLPNKARFGATYPEVFKVNQNISLKIVLNLMASDVLSKGKVYGAKAIICLKQVGGVAPAPNNHPTMVKLNPFSKMSFTDTDFTSGDIGKIAYYIFYWVDKDGKAGPESVVFFYTVK